MLRIFCQDLDSGEPAFYCGTTLDESLQAIQHILESSVDALLDRQLDEVNIQLSRKEMTDEEINNLPEI